jgi:hypothetical protein
MTETDMNLKHLLSVNVIAGMPRTIAKKERRRRKKANDSIQLDTSLTYGDGLQIKIELDI